MAENAKVLLEISFETIVQKFSSPAARRVSFPDFTSKGVHILGFRVCGRCIVPGPTSRLGRTGAREGSQVGSETFRGFFSDLGNLRLDHIWYWLLRIRSTVLVLVFSLRLSFTLPI